MEQELFNKIQERKREYQKISSENYEEIEELEKNSLVKRYIYLTKLKKYMEQENYLNGEYPNIANDTLKEYGYGKIYETNGVWIFIMDLTVKDYKKVFNNTVIDEPEDGMVAVYRDAENNQREIVIPLEDKKEFESTHRVIMGDMKDENPIEKYYLTRLEFFKMMIEDGQEEAVSKILDKYGVNKGKHR